MAISNKAKEIIIKINIVVAAIFLLLLFPVLPIISFFIDEKLLATFFYTDLIAFFVSGAVLIILLPIFGLKPKPVKAEKIPHLFNDFDSLLVFVRNSAIANSYKEQPTIPFAVQKTLTIFTRPNGLWKLDCIALVRTCELSDDILNVVNNKITESLKSYYGKNQITDTVSLISIICVDRITPSFQKLVNSGIQQGLKNWRLPVGISFGGKSIYIARQKDGFAITKYKKLRNEFLGIMGLLNSEK